MAMQESVIPEYRSISKPQNVLGLPPGYAVLLLMAAAIHAVVFGYLLSAIVMVVLLWGLGAAVTWRDPHAWTLFSRMRLVPKVLKP